MGADALRLSAQQQALIAPVIVTVYIMIIMLGSELNLITVADMQVLVDTITSQLYFVSVYVRIVHVVVS